jgi:hypothetical protein
MDWENKVKMVQYLNSDDDKYLDIVIDNLDIMDEQAWDMFFTGLTITKKNIEKNIDKHRTINFKSKNIQTDSFRTALRMALYDELLS